ncbi:uncharacterized protein LOC128233397 [Mya arenaria]|uniref:uncharacterized protein LOC128233397 n=1 Tax=Mya arenaria TaxID=6604 RepID=UPI0022E8F1C4|nr:uncharacterized protein LOC128233397 [Mya arenaria]
MDYLKIMKTVETLSIFVAIILVTWSSGDGAPQWRPQGRFGKRFSSSRSSDIMAALSSNTFPDSDEQLEPYFMDNSDIDFVNSNTFENMFGSNSQNGRPSSVPSGFSSRLPFVSSRICIETSLPGVFKCHRKGQTESTMVTLQDD